MLSEFGNSLRNGISFLSEFVKTLRNEISFLSEFGKPLRNEIYCLSELANSLRNEIPFLSACSEAFVAERSWHDNIIAHRLNSLVSELSVCDVHISCMSDKPNSLRIGIPILSEFAKLFKHEIQVLDEF